MKHGAKFFEHGKVYGGDGGVGNTGGVVGGESFFYEKGVRAVNAAGFENA